MIRYTSRWILSGTLVLALGYSVLAQQHVASFEIHGTPVKR
jgi:hypothetical protein